MPSEVPPEPLPPPEAEDPEPARVLPGGRRVGAVTGRPLPPISPAYTHRMMEALRRTRPWVLVVAGFILVGVVLAFLILLTTLVNAFNLGLVAILPVSIVVGLGIPYFIAGLRLTRYAAGIKTFLDTGTTAAFEEAMGAQCRFWRLIGILMLVVLGLYALAFSLLAISGLLR